MSREPLTVTVPGGALAADRWPGRGPTVVLLHAGVADRRGWTAVAEPLAAAGLDVVAYDRRGFGATPPGDAPFSHLDDLRAVLDATAGDRPAWLVGNSMGGALALDAALELPERVAGLVLLTPGVSGTPEVEDLDAATQALDARLETATGEEALRLEAWLWLDGPAQPEGRVAGAARELALDMNRAIQAHGAAEGAGASGVEAAGRLDELRGPVTVAWGDADLPAVVGEVRDLVAALGPGRVRTHVFPGVAHLPSLEVPQAVADLVLEAVRATDGPTGTA